MIAENNNKQPILFTAEYLREIYASDVLCSYV